MRDNIYCVGTEPEWQVCFLPLEVCLPLGFGLIMALRDLLMGSLHT